MTKEKLVVFLRISAFTTQHISQGLSESAEELLSFPVSLDSHPVCELSCDVVVVRSLGVSEELAVGRVHHGDAELDNVLLIVFFYHIGILCHLANKNQHCIAVTMVMCCSLCSRGCAQKNLIPKKQGQRWGPAYLTGLRWKQNHSWCPGT